MTMPTFEPVAYADGYGNVITKATKEFSRNIMTNSFAVNLHPADQLQQAYEAGKRDAAPNRLIIKVADMRESNGRVTWSVFLAKSEDDKPWDWHQVYSDSIEGRARYEAAVLDHFLGNGPQPDILTFDTDAAPQVEQEPVHQFRKEFCSNWYDGFPDNDDGGGPYQTRTLYAAPQIPAVPQWQPIDTAPEATHVFVWLPNYGTVRGIYTLDQQRQRWWNGEEVIYPTHWMPLPASPACSTVASDLEPTK